MRLEDLCIFLSRGKSPKYSEEPNSYPVFAQKCNLKDGGISLKQARFLDALTIEKWDPIYYLRENDILINSTGTGTVGRTRLFKDSYLGNYAFTVPDSHVSVIRLIEFLNPQYIFSVISSDVFQQYLENNLAGSTNQKELYIDVIGKMWIPLPGIIEQDFIAQKIEHSFDILINLDKHSSGLSSYIKTVKSKILELAMQGKLVPQDPTDEPAAEMLKRINPKAKIISDNPHSWNIPQGWVIANLKELIYSPSSKQFQILQSQIKQDGLIPVISQSSNFIEGYSENVDKAFHPNNGIVIFGDHTKNVKFFSGSFIIGADGVKLIDWDFDKRFLFHLITYVSEKIPNKGYSRHFQYLLPYVIGLPPLEEQKRIVAKIEELYSVLDKIEASLQS